MLLTAAARQAGCGGAGSWLRRGGRLVSERGGWLQRLQSVAANEVLLIAASGKGRSRRSAAWWAGGDEIMIYEVMHFWRRVVRGRRVGGEKAVDKATINIF